MTIFSACWAPVTSHISFNLHNVSLRKLFLSAVCKGTQAPGSQRDFWVRAHGWYGEGGTRCLRGWAHLSGVTSHTSISAAGIDSLPSSSASLGQTPASGRCCSFLSASLLNLASLSLYSQWSFRVRGLETIEFKLKFQTRKQMHRRGINGWEWCMIRPCCRITNCPQTRWLIEVMTCYSSWFYGWTGRFFSWSHLGLLVWRHSAEKPFILGIFKPWRESPKRAKVEALSVWKS